MLTIAIDLVHQTFLLFLLGGCVVGIVAGLAMLINPDGVLRLNQYLSKWYSTERLSDALDKQRKVEREIYRHHRLAGALIVVGAIYTLYILNFAFSRQATAVILSDRDNFSLVEWLLDALVLAFNVGCLTALVVGVILMMRPSFLKGSESRLNRWVNTEKSMHTLDVMRHGLDHFIASHLRITGALVIVGSIYVISVLKNIV